MADLPTSSTGERFARLVEIMARLRADGGCPWDREQTFDSIKAYTLEEVYEVLDAIDARNWPALADELGDLLLQCVFYAQMAAEDGRFTIDDSLDAINEKLIRRHPHVFGQGDARTSAQVKQRWDEIKAEEKKHQGAAARPLLEGISRSQPALAEAAQISSRVASVGFDWESIDHVLEKLQEELGELARARQATSGLGPRKGVVDSGVLEEEIGDVLFVVVNIARHLAVDPEQALRKACAKFRRRFGMVETRLSERGRPLGQATLDELEDAWQEVKRRT